MKLYIATIAAAGSLICTAQADQNLDEYRKCWANASTTVIDARGVSGRTLSYAVFVADSQCRPVKIEAMATNSLSVMNWVSEQLVVKLHNAHRAEDKILQDVASTTPDRE